MVTLSINDFKNEKIFFSGIGGVSMSSLAMILKSNGFSVCGSDRASSHITDKLENSGIKVYLKQEAANISEIGLVVRTAAVSDDNPEILRARELGIPVMERCTLLGQVMKNYKERINIAGTHGKTTTTSMMSLILMYAGVEPTIMVGGDFDKIGGNLLIGEKDYFVCEACEYVESFLEFFPTSSIILNIEADHLDYYRDIEHIKSAFSKFILRTDNIIMLNGDDANACDIIKATKDKNIILFGIENGKYKAKNIIYNKSTTEYDLYCNNVFIGKITLKVAGEHSVYNSLAVSGLALELGIDISHIKSALFDFTGAKRRMELVGSLRDGILLRDGISIYDDYAHHPTEIQTTISSIRQKNPKRLVVLFQPHTYTRTRALKQEFIDVLSKGIDKLYILDIYAAREKNTGDIHSNDLVSEIEGALYIKDLEDAAEIIKNELKDGDIFVTVGAGDVFKVGQSLLINEQ